MQHETDKHKAHARLAVRFLWQQSAGRVPNKAHQDCTLGDQSIMELDSGDRETGSVLESALIDQRMRADRHRANFESLKAQHLTLQEVLC